LIAHRPLREMGRGARRVAFEILTAAGPSSAVQCAFNGGPHTTALQMRQCQVVWPPPCPSQATCPTRTRFGQRVTIGAAARRTVDPPARPSTTELTTGQ